MTTILKHETSAYLIFGILTMLISISSRLIIKHFLGFSAGMATNIANIIAIIFAFVTNDRYVFKQRPEGWPKRLFSFTLSRLVTLWLDWWLSYFFVDQHPGIIGQYLNHNHSQVFQAVTLFSQVAVIVLNYVLSKLFVFTNKKTAVK